MKLAGKTALVTGGAARLGKAICEALAARGAHVVIHYNRSGPKAHALAERLRRGGGRAFCVQGRLDGPGADCKGIVEQAKAEAGRLDILVNNAAVFALGSLAGAEETRAQEIFDVNFFAPMSLIRAFVASTAKGAIINMLDRRIAAVDPTCAPYALSKKALADLTLAAALELAPGFTVNGVAPGPALPPPKSSKAGEKAGRLPLGRRPTPRDIAGAVVFLLENDSITGQILYVDCGQHLLGNRLKACKNSAQGGALGPTARIKTGRQSVG